MKIKARITDPARTLFQTCYQAFLGFFFVFILLNTTSITAQRERIEPPADKKPIESDNPNAISRKRVEPDPPANEKQPPAKKEEPAQKKQTDEQKKLGQYILIRPDERDFYALLGTAYTAQTEIPLTANANFDSSGADYWGGFAGAGIKGPNFFGEFILGYNQIGGINYAFDDFEFIEEDISWTKWTFLLRAGYLHQVHKLAFLEAGAGFHFAVWGNRTINSQEEVRSNYENLYLHLYAGVKLTLLKQVFFRAGLSYDYNLTPGFRGSVGINNLYSHLLRPEISILYQF